MRPDADHLACVRDPALELLLSHTATLTNKRHGRTVALDSRAVTAWFRRREVSAGGVENPISAPSQG